MVLKGSGREVDEISEVELVSGAKGIRHTRKEPKSR